VAVTTQHPVDESEIAGATFRQVGRRLLPLLGVCYFLSYLDRTNISVAALTMNADIGLSDAAFGLGAGLFFIGYFFFEVPSNMVMHRVGARIWMARIMVSWGIVAGLQAFVVGETSFYVVRILLGIAEAGFFPGMILYLTYWFPAEYRARAVGWFMAAVPLSTALGAPLGGLLLRLDGVAGLAGWQWLFLVEAVPTVIIGFLLLRWLPDRPSQVDWLSDDQKGWLQGRLDEEARASEGQHISEWQSLRHPRVLGLSLVYFSIVFGLYGLGFWLPTIVQESLQIEDTLDVTLLTAAPYVVGTVAIVVVGRIVDRQAKPARITIGAMTVGGVGLAATAWLSENPWVGYAGLCLCAVAVMASFPGFWRLPTAFLTGAAAAAGIAVVNSIGNLSGFVGPYWIGFLSDATGTSQWGLVSIGVVMVAGAGLTALLTRDAKTV
jgi:ACS family tartrate transporter-like MFS transporter